MSPSSLPFLLKVAHPALMPSSSSALLRKFYKFRIPADEAKRYAAAAGAGLILAAAFPKWGMAGFAWVAPGLMLMAGLGCTGSAAFRVGYVGGLAFYLGALSW